MSGRFAFIIQCPRAEGLLNHFTTYIILYIYAYTMNTVHRFPTIIIIVENYYYWGCHCAACVCASEKFGVHRVRAQMARAGNDRVSLVPFVCENLHKTIKTVDENDSEI